MLSEGLICFVSLSGVNQGPVTCVYVYSGELDSPTPQPGTSSPGVLTKPELLSHNNPCLHFSFPLFTQPSPDPLLLAFHPADAFSSYSSVFRIMRLCPAIGTLSLALLEKNHSNFTLIVVGMYILGVGDSVAERTAWRRGVREKRI